MNSGTGSLGWLFLIGGILTNSHEAMIIGAMLIIAGQLIELKDTYKDSDD